LSLVGVAVVVGRGGLVEGKVGAGRESPVELEALFKFEESEGFLVLFARCEGGEGWSLG